MSEAARQTAITAELRRLAYMDGMGIVQYVSRSSLPAAATSTRVPLPVTTATAVPAARQDTSLTPLSADKVVLTAQASPVSSTPARTGAAPVNSVQFSLAAIVAGHWLWLEDLQKRPLAREQVRLIRAMARALERLQRSKAGTTRAGTAAQEPSAQPGATTSETAADIALFDWPIHHNRQLDLGIDAARGAVTGFVARKIEQHDCRGVVLLGNACTQWVAGGELGLPCVSTLSSAEILADSSLKPGVWAQLQLLCRESH